MRLAHPLVSQLLQKVGDEILSAYAKSPTLPCLPRLKGKMRWMHILGEDTYVTAQDAVQRGKRGDARSTRRN